MHYDNKPVFYSESGKRWKFFLSLFSIGAILTSLVIFAVFFSLLDASGVALPRLVHRNEIYRRVLDPRSVTTLETHSNTAYQLERLRLKQVQSRRKKSAAVFNRIHSAFYVGWDIQSYYSLHSNIDKLNLVFPEWFFIPDRGEEIIVNIDKKGLELLKKHRVAIVPMVSNYFKDKWNGKNVERILSSHSHRAALINSLLRALEKYGLQGINIDFEELTGESNEQLTLFMKELSEALHAKHYLLTQDVAPYNEDYDLKKLSQYNDYLILMAYDMHDTKGLPGPIASLPWVEGALGAVLRDVPPEKVILGIAAYGYDWPKGSEGVDVTYQEALVNAQHPLHPLAFDPLHSNLTYSYLDANQHVHEVWLMDAAGTFNTLRMAQDQGLAGAALWRLGSEDTRLWEFWTQDLSLEGLRKKPLDLTRLKDVPVSSSIDYEGDGEILDVVSTPQPGKIDISYDGKKEVISQESYQVLPTAYTLLRSGSQEKSMVLTFDDGPDERYTPQILDILKKEKVPAAFFIVGKNAENNLSLLRRIYQEGHEIGNHSFSHPNLAVTSLERTELELSATRRLIECVTGHSTVLFRPPYNADSEPETVAELNTIAIAKKNHYYTVAESIDTRDWEAHTTVERIMEKIRTEEHSGNMILLHDSGGDRSETVKALPQIIHYFKSKGYRFITVAEAMGKTRYDIMPPLKDAQERRLAKINWWVAEGIYELTNAAFWIFFICIFLSIVRMLCIAVLAVMQKNRHNTLPTLSTSSQGLVSILVPAYNEEINVVASIKSLLNTHYPLIELIVVDDGSTDNTYALLQEAFALEPRVRLFTGPNGGKAAALNRAIQEAKGDYVVCIDADTQLPRDAIGQLVKYFSSPTVGAVAGNVKVGNEINWLARFQALEYITSQNFDRRAFDLLNCITVIPGAIGAFRRAVLNEVGGYSSDTLAEDCDVTLRILEKGYQVVYAEEAIAVTEAPETLRMFLKQRFRWSFGILQCVFKHGRYFFSPSVPTLGYIALPNMLIFQFILPILSPLVDAVMVFSLVNGFWQETLGYYLLFTGVDVAVSSLAFYLNEGGYPKLLWILPQRFCYRQLMYWVLFKSILAAMKGKLVQWGALTRTGNAELHIVKEPHEITYETA